MRIHTTVLALALAGPGLAQSFNIDFGSPSTAWGVPSQTYGGAAGVAGEWNSVDPASGGAPMYTSAPLININSGTTAVTIDFDSTSGTNYFNFDFDEPNTTGDDQALLDDLVWVNGNDHNLTINGLAAGDYVIYTYAMAPDSATGTTRVSVPGSPDPAADVAGDFSMGFVRDNTHAEHRITVAAGASVVVEITFVSWGDSLSGMQIVGSGGSALGANYCMANANSTGNPGVISGSGRLTAADNDVTLTASSLPNNSFGFFITSQMRGFVANPAGSAGNLCLGGAIGRYVGSGQIQFSGNAGTFDLVLDLTQTPTPGGLVGVNGGETWDFQAWFRDSSPAGPTSNFTDALEIMFI